MFNDDLTSTDFLNMTLREISDYLEDNHLAEAWLDGTGSMGRMRLSVKLESIKKE